MTAKVNINDRTKVRAEELTIFSSNLGKIEHNLKLKARV